MDRRGLLQLVWGYLLLGQGMKLMKRKPDRVTDREFVWEPPTPRDKYNSLFITIDYAYGSDSGVDNYTLTYH